MASAPPRPSRFPGARSVSIRRVLTVDGELALERDETVAGEEPLQIRASGPGQEPVDVAVTMRTPGHEDELAAGFLLTEGLVRSGDIGAFRHGDPVRMARPDDEITVELSRSFSAADVPDRNFVATASCGLC